MVAGALAATIAHCSWFRDPATSLVLVIERGANQLESSPSFKATIVHPPNSSDCPDAYRVELVQQGALTVSCFATDDPTKVVSSHTSDLHLKHVDVRETTTVDKKRGEPLSIEIAKSAGKPVIERVF
jgi:hypothetical protein